MRTHAFNVVNYTRHTAVAVAAGRGQISPASFVTRRDSRKNTLHVRAVTTLLFKIDPPPA